MAKKISKRKGGDPRKRANGNNGSKFFETRGRHPKEDRGEIVRNNGFTRNQWLWLEREAALKDMDTMTYIRKYPIQWWIDSVEASRAGPLATPEEDEMYEKLVVSKRKLNK